MGNSPSNPVGSVSSQPRTTGAADSCPVSPEAREVWLRQNQKPPQQTPADASSTGLTPHNSRPLGAFESASCASSQIDRHSSNERSLGSSLLGERREVSSIPKAWVAHMTGSVNGGESRDLGQAESNKEENWVYPSESQFFSALVRKSHAPNPADMKNVVPLHNAVNERTWAMILQWEEPYTLAGHFNSHYDGSTTRSRLKSSATSRICLVPKLLSFSGDYSKLSPRARLRILLGYQRPFDRHDWVIDRCGTRVDYVIDFYEGKAGVRQGVNFFLDVRPKLNTFEGCKMRLARFWGLEGWI